MMKRNFFQLFLVATFSFACCCCEAFELNTWRAQSSTALSGLSGEAISSPSFDASSWHARTDDPAATSTTAAAAYAGDADRLYYGRNIETLSPSLFNGSSWWFRATFPSPALAKAGVARLVLKGVSYRGDVWVNGVQVASRDDVAGTFRWFELDVTRLLASGVGSTNAVALNLTCQDDSWHSTSKSIDLGITFVDWDPEPPDSSLGVWQPVELAVTAGPVSLTAPLVQTEVSFGTSVALVTLGAVAKNWAATDVSGVLTATLDGVGSVTQAVVLAAGESRTVVFRAADYAVLRISSPRLWWPWQMGAQEFYNLTLRFVLSDNTVSDTLRKNVGLREVTSEIDERGHRQYFVNGQPILIRGAGWTPDLLLRTSHERQETELRYVRDMGLNTVRMEGKFEEESFYDVADSIGLLVMPGWCCCDAWQRWSLWGPEQHLIARESLRSQIRRLRSHASVFVFLVGSDTRPTPDVESEFLEVFGAEFWPNPTLSSASAATSTITGPSGVKMSGPYSWVPPNYWMTDTKQEWGGGWGFLTEGGPGENPLLIGDVERTLPAEHFWPIDDWWNFHCGNTRGHFGSLDRFNGPLEARMGAASGLEDYSHKAAAMVYESHRAMFEAYTRNRYVSTGVIQWMQNSAFPSMIWRLYSWYLVPDAAYFGTKSACEPVHVLYGYDDRSAWVSNSLYKQFAPQGGMKLLVRALTPSGKELFQKEVSIAGLEADSVKRAFELPKMADGTGPYFLRLCLQEASTGIAISTSTYWLTDDTSDVVDWDYTSGSTPPCLNFSDYSSLQSMPPAALQVSSTHEKISPTEGKTVVTLENPESAPVAFLVHVRILRGNSSAEDVAPIFWTANFVTLLPSEIVSVEAKYKLKDLKGAEPFVLVTPWNTKQ